MPQIWEPTHPIAAVNFVVKAIWAGDPKEGGTKIARERDWQYRRLVELNASQESGITL